MKKTDLDKMRGLAIQGRLKQSATPERFARGSAEPVDRREQRKMEREQGLVPFAVKLDGALVQKLRARAGDSGVPLNELVAELLEKALAAKK